MVYSYCCLLKEVNLKCILRWFHSILFTGLLISCTKKKKSTWKNWDDIHLADTGTSRLRPVLLMLACLISTTDCSHVTYDVLYACFTRIFWPILRKNLFFLFGKIIIIQNILWPQTANSLGMWYKNIVEDENIYIGLCFFKIKNTERSLQMHSSSDHVKTNSCKEEMCKVPSKHQASTTNSCDNAFIISYIFLPFIRAICYSSTQTKKAVILQLH